MNGNAKAWKKATNRDTSYMACNAVYTAKLKYAV